MGMGAFLTSLTLRLGLVLALVLVVGPKVQLLELVCQLLEERHDGGCGCDSFGRGNWRGGRGRCLQGTDGPGTLWLAGDQRAVPHHSSRSSLGEKGGSRNPHNATVVKASRSNPCKEAVRAGIHLRFLGCLPKLPTLGHLQPQHMLWKSGSRPWQPIMQS